MATTISQAARDASPERESSTSVASEIQTHKIMALLQQIVANQIKEKRARENDKEKREERERERQKREQERFEVLKETVGEKLVQFSGRIDEVKEENDGGQQEGNEEREEEGGEMSHEKEGAEESAHLPEERERAVQEQKSEEAESQKGAESQEEEERRICLSPQAQRQVLEMIPVREGQGTAISCGITVAVDAWLKGGSDVAVDSRNTCGFVVDASLKGGGGNPALHR